METQTTVSKAFAWKLLERFSVMGVQFIIQIVLAYYLTPKEYGYLGTLLIFMQIANVFVQTGFNSALIQAKTVDDADYASVLWINLTVGAGFIGVLFLAAPAIAQFYAAPILCPGLRVLSLMLIPGAINSVQLAHLSRQLNFRVVSLSSFLSGVISGGVGIYAAMSGWGLWALIAQQLTNQVVNTIVLSAMLRWRPTLTLSRHRLKQLFRFGSKMMASNLIDTVYNNLYGAVVGKFFSQSVFGYFTQAQKFPMLIQDALNGALSSVLLPVMSKEQAHVERVKGMLRKSMMLGSYLIVPTLVGLAVCARPVILLILKEKWLPSVPYLQILCLTYIFFPVHTSNLQAITAIGRSDIFLQLEVLKKIQGVLCLAVTIPFGVMAMTWSKLVYAILSSVINAAPNKRLLGYAYWEQMRDLLPNFGLTLAMAVPTALCSYLPLSPLPMLGLQVVVGMGIYLGLSAIFKVEGYRMCTGYLKRKTRRAA